MTERELLDEIHSLSTSAMQILSGSVWMKKCDMVETKAAISKSKSIISSVVELCSNRIDEIEAASNEIYKISLRRLSGRKIRMRGTNKIMEAFNVR